MTNTFAFMSAFRVALSSKYFIDISVDVTLLQDATRIVLEKSTSSPKNNQSFYVDLMIQATKIFLKRISLSHRPIHPLVQQIKQGFTYNKNVHTCYKSPYLYKLTINNDMGQSFPQIGTCMLGRHIIQPLVYDSKFFQEIKLFQTQYNHHNFTLDTTSCVKTSFNINRKTHICYLITADKI